MLHGTPTNVEVRLVDQPTDESTFVDLDHVKKCYPEQGDVYVTWTGHKKSRRKSKRHPQSHGAELPSDVKSSITGNISTLFTGNISPSFTGRTTHSFKSSNDTVSEVEQCVELLDQVCITQILIMCVHILCYALCIHVSSIADVGDDLRAQRGELSFRSFIYHIIIKRYIIIRSVMYHVSQSTSW